MGASSTIGNYLLPAVVSEFRRTYPRIKIHLLVGNTKRIVELLKGGIIDVGLVEGDVSRYKLTVQKLISDELALIVSAHHPWAALKEVSMLELPKEPFIFREEGSGTRQMIERHLQRFGLTAQSLNISAILGSTEAIKEAVEAGIGVSILSRWTVRKELRYGSLRALRFREGQLLRDFSLLFNKNTVSTYSVETFLSFLRNYPYEKLLDGALP